MATIKVGFTKANIDALDQGNIIRDKKVRGLIAIGRKTGASSYCFRSDLYRDGHFIRTVQKTLGRADTMNVTKARRLALKAKTELQAGKDLVRDGTSGVGPVTMCQALDRHIKDKQLRPRTIQDYEHILDRMLRPLSARPMHTITVKDVSWLRSRLEEKHGMTSARNALKLARALWTVATKMEPELQAKPNPWSLVGKPPPRKAKPTLVDLPTLALEIEQADSMRRMIHLIAVLTGARRSSILNIRTDDVFLGEGPWIRLTWLKTRAEPATLPIGERLASELRDFRKGVPDGWLFPADSRSGHIEEPRCTAISARLHQCRHTFSHLAVESGADWLTLKLLMTHEPGSATSYYVNPMHLVEKLRPTTQAIEDLAFERGLGSKKVITFELVPVAD